MRIPPQAARQAQQTTGTSVTTRAYSSTLRRPHGVDAWNGLSRFQGRQMPQVKFLLDESNIPTHWYNVVADLPTAPAPPLGPDGTPVRPEALAAIFPPALIEQEVSRERW